MSAHPCWSVTYLVIAIVSLNIFHRTRFFVRATPCSEPSVIEDDILGDKRSGRNRRAATSIEKKLWPGGVIPYVIADSFTSEYNHLVETAVSWLPTNTAGSWDRFGCIINIDKQLPTFDLDDTVSLIRKSMNHWQAYTCLSFVKRTNEKDYIYIYSGKGCCSYVGKRGNKQDLSLGRGCDSFGIIVHELGHAIGFWHEQSRPDRDNYVKILYHNVYPLDRHNFKKMKERQVNSRDQRYDYHSIMHYGSNFFAKKGGQDTILPLLRGVKKEELGIQYFSHHRYALSNQDKIQTNLMYRCNIFNENGDSTIFSRSGSFKSPNHPGPYSVSRDRVWIITTEKHHKNSLTLIFQNFSVGTNDRTGICKNDYLDIRNGKGFLSPYLIQFCGNVTPDPITVLSESIYVRLHSELPIYKSVGPKKGFLIKFKTDECSRRMFKLRDIFTSPNFPYRYQPDTDCVWQINVPKGYRIKVTFHLFRIRDVHNKEGCLDYVDLRDGDSPFSTFFGRFCGGNNPSTVTSTSTSFRIIFHSTTPHTEKSANGFAASYEAIDVDECAEKTSECEQACFNKRGGYLCGCHAGYSFIPGVYGACVDKNECEMNNGGCSHGCENTDGGFYCTCPEGHYLVSNGKICTDINECELMPCAHGCKNFIGSFECTCQKGYELNNDQRTCEDINECKQSPCEQKCINTHGSYKCSCLSGYILDENENKCKVLPTCGKIYTTTTGKIRSPPVPSLLPHPVECHWNVRVPRAKVIDINVLISWERNAKCSNYLRLQYKSGGREVVLTFCGKEDVKENILIKRNNLLIKYHVESETDNQMSLKYTSSLKDSQCKKTFTTSSGSIQTPRFPFNYPSNTRCQWIIKNTEKRPLRVRFGFFEIENHASCKFDYLDIRITDRDTRNTNYVGRFCGSNLSNVPEFLEIHPGKEMRMLFKSDSIIQRRGFHVYFQMV